jgi:hypothetical protein
MRFGVTALLFAASVGLAVMARAETAPDKQPSRSVRQDDDALAARLAWIPTNSGRLSVADLQAFVEVATALQARTPEQVGAFLERISLDDPIDGSTRFILLRFLFELPDAYVPPIWTLSLGLGRDAYFGILGQPLLADPLALRSTRVSRGAARLRRTSVQRPPGL